MKATTDNIIATDNSAIDRHIDWKRALLWACFLGSSWTWVIGMFLPVLLVRDFGLAGWVVFAIPNVVGAAAMAFILPNAAASQRAVQQHKAAALWFSIITASFQIFAGTWIIYHILGVGGIIGAAAVLLLIWALYTRSTKSMLFGAVMITVISLALFAWWLGTSFNGWTPVNSKLSTTDLILFAPASLIGFLLCPYLDLTFHRARQATGPNTGKAAFVIGFGIVFAAMILFSLLYAGQMLTAATGAVIIGLQFLFQAGFTAGIHINEISSRRTCRRWSFPCAAGIIIISALAGVWALTGPFNLLQMTAGETIYRCFLVFYGLVFPAYVWLVMIPTHAQTSMRQRKTVWAIATIICLPMAFLFIVALWSWWILGVLGVLIIAKAALEISFKPKKQKKINPQITQIDTDFKKRN